MTGLCNMSVIHNQIFILIYNSKGGFTFNEVYNLPIYLRRYYLKRLKQQYDEENSAYKKASKTPSRPNIKKSKQRR